MNQTQHFLLEIGSEEIPARFLPLARQALERLVLTSLSQWQLTYDRVIVLGTPRRLTLMIEGLPSKQADQEVTVTGPAWSTAFDQIGQPTQATLGFAKKQGIEATQLEKLSTARGDVVGLRRLVTGKSSQALLANEIPKWIGAIPFGKNMTWETSGLRFARPLRWLVALLDDQVLDVEIADIKAGRLSQGHRVQGKPFAIEHASLYTAAAEQNYVMLSPAARRDRIVTQANALVAKQGLTIEWDEVLLDEVVELVEWPTPFLATFSTHFLALPDVVLEAPMKKHQRYFPLRDQQGKLSNYFLFIANQPSDPKGFIAAGNARVLAARLTDAMFFWQHDLAIPLATQAQKLKTIVWQDGLGTLENLSQRVGELAKKLAPMFGANPITVGAAAQLYLADLGSQMVYEFAELQGVMGKIYYEQQQEKSDPALATAIYEAHLPKTATDALPTSPAGQTLALAHRLDLIVGNLIKGHEVKGNQDPFGLRRAAIAVFRILEQTSGDYEINGDLRELTQQHAQSQYQQQGIALPENLVTSLNRFWQARLEGYLANDFASEQITAVLQAKRIIMHPLPVRYRLQALAELAQADGLTRFLDTYKRLRNIARTVEPLPREALLAWTDAPTQFFVERIQAIWHYIDQHRDHWPEASLRFLQMLQNLEQAAQQLFTDVRINDPNQVELSTLRQRLVATAREVFDVFAHFDVMISG